jgi:hypothetical protein
VAEQESVVKKTAIKRKTLQRQIAELAEQSKDYLEKKVKASGAAKASLDAKLYEAIRVQAGKKGMRYEAPAAAY